ncbi:mechanosensitive ion channel protein MscS [Pigmentiphaga litoralis]|uniref:mechanosensitive ion channel family protein n=1 Tax=Pigmentiphaga litoralis TaxID=516702 RepID=UPI001677ACF2|nr:mechanosensitive ion channel family protein [Pigmentiphaga litoralis]GGX32090.1 mechanosensitive ion channel protein MscS [Pigmentiphaga litoralis]
MNSELFSRFLNDVTFLGIPTISWLIAIAAMVVSFVVLRTAVSFLRRRLTASAAHSHSLASELAAVVIGGTSNILIGLVAILIGAGLLDLPPRWMDRVSSLWFVVVVLQVALWGTRSISLAMTHYVHAKLGEQAQISALSSLMMWGAKVLLWAVVLLAMLSNLGVNITAFVASLGVGGIAIALAVQNILGDLFASLSIAVDKPFEIGDFIVIGSLAGTVEHVGLKTTRIRSLGGEQIVMANTEMLSSTIQNYKRLNERRIVFQFGVTYDCTASQAKQIPQLVESIIRSIDRTRFDRSHFKGFGDSSLDFETVYIVLEPGYNTYMDIQQEINLRLMEELASIDVEFAFPTRTIHVASVPPAARSHLPGDSSPQAVGDAAAP